MNKYRLAEDECIVFKCVVRLEGEEKESSMILTTRNFVFNIKREGDNEIKAFPSTNIKIYREQPQVLVSGKTVTVYAKEGELSFDCENLVKARSVRNKIKRFVDGKDVSFKKNIHIPKGIKDKVKNVDKWAIIASAHDTVTDPRLKDKEMPMRKKIGYAVGKFASSYANNKKGK